MEFWLRKKFLSIIGFYDNVFKNKLDNLAISVDNTDFVWYSIITKVFKEKRLWKKWVKESLRY